MTVTGARIAIVSLILAAFAGAGLIVSKSPDAHVQDTPASYGH
jgi:hypothetical protein